MTFRQKFGVVGRGFLRSVQVHMSNKSPSNGTAKCNNVLNLLTPLVVAFNRNIPQRYLQCTSMRS